MVQAAWVLWIKPSRLKAVARYLGFPEERMDAVMRDGDEGGQAEA